MSCCFQPAWAQLQEVKVWEYEPYEVEVWCDFDASVIASPLARQQFEAQLLNELQYTFQAAWRVAFRQLPTELQSAVRNEFSTFELDEITSNELVLVVSLNHESAKTIRTYDAALEQLPSIRLTEADLQRLQAAMAAGFADARTRMLIDKCMAGDESVETLVTGLTDGEFAAALLPRWAIDDNIQLRSLLTPLPWQTASLFQQRDKLFFLSVGMQDERYTVKLRELDCPMQYLGPAFDGSTMHWSQAARTAANLFPNAFAPVARVDEANSTTAELLVKASGLIVEPDNPAIVHVGDLLHPIVRRDDRNGIPTLLEPQSWTFAAVTNSDGMKLQANVYAYSGGPGLQGRRNRRTQRMLLRVRPIVEETQIEVVVRSTGQPQPGYFVYERDLLTDQFEYLGRTDWRGRFTVPVPEQFGAILPDEIRRKKYQSIREAEAARALAESNQSAAATESPPATEAVQAEISQLPEIFDASPFEIKLRAPLKQIYIKSGDAVLGKLPMVPGLRPIEVAKLADDSRRLEAEGFVRGFQSEIVDLIGLRNLLAAKIRLNVRNDNLDAARTALSELRRLRNYEAMATELGLIQRRVIDSSQADAPRFSKIQIDRMFQNTRELMQRYLQDSLIRDCEALIQAAGTAAG